MLMGRTRGSPYSDTWQVRTGHVARPYVRHVACICTGDMWQAPERDTCQADLAFLARSWTHPEVTRVTTERVTRGRVTSAADVAGLRGR
jgi:hypothetical protein